jgi:OPA family glycerol-3-phosphate transporter-like MFS transporter
VDLLIVVGCFATVIGLYFWHNPMGHNSPFMWRRFVNWFPLGMTYGFLYMARYNLSAFKNVMGEGMTNEDFGWIFGVGSFVYAASLFINGPLVDRIGGKKGIIMAALGSCLANIAMGVVAYLYFHKQIVQHTLYWLFIGFYALNMFFQSYGAVSIIKVKAYWFHVRERGLFGGIFGTLISIGLYFAFDWGRAILDASRVHVEGPATLLRRMFITVFAVDTGQVDAYWLVFFIPALILVGWALLDTWLICDTPSQAGFPDFDTHDASSGEMHMDFTIWQLIKKVFSNPIVLMVAMVEFTSGILRNGIMMWYQPFTKQVSLPGSEFFTHNWGLLLFITGILGGFAGGLISDFWFQSRRGPPAGLFNILMFVTSVTMSVFLFSNGNVVGCCAVIMVCAVIGVHSLMSASAAADFGGRKATATASGVSDGFVYLGSGFQSICLGYLTERNWQWWPIFLAPFCLLGLYLATRMWHALPAATRRYMQEKSS